MQNLDSSSNQLPFLSIVTVVAFETDRLARTLKSVEGLSGNIEHIFIVPKVDDVSTKLILDYSNNVSFPVITSNDSGIGIYPAMNIGIQASSGRYCYFLNAGDEIYDQTQFESNLVSVFLAEPEWAILGCCLPWNNSYYTYPDMAKRYLKQEKNAYVSHQSIVVKRELIDNLNGFDISLKVAADTLMTMQLTNISTPLTLDGIAIKVERGNTVTASNRLSRFETMRAVIKLQHNKSKFIAILNILKKELGFLFKKITRFIAKRVQESQ